MKLIESSLILLALPFLVFSCSGAKRNMRYCEKDKDIFSSNYICERKVFRDTICIPSIDVDTLIQKLEQGKSTPLYSLKGDIEQYDIFRDGQIIVFISRGSNGKYYSSFMKAGFKENSVVIEEFLDAIRQKECGE